LNSTPRIGVVGAGSLGYHHIRILRETPNVQFTGFAETNAERAAKVREELGTKSMPLDDLIEASDALTIVVPTPLHHEVAKAALTRGKHVFIEKPITVTLGQADELLHLAERNGCIIQIGHVERFNQAVRAALPYISDARFIESERLAGFNPRGSDVAVVLDLMIHDIDLILTLVSSAAATISAVGVPVLTPMLDIANARITFESGAVANITSSRISRDRVRKIRIFQQSGYISLDLAAGRGDFFRLKSGLNLEELTAAPLNMLQIVDHVPLTAPEGEPLRLEFESFVEALAGRAPVTVTGQDGRRALDIALRIVSEIERTLPSIAAGSAPFTRA
jgi:predicted dehydrogenase